jgi:hypothetical protein
VFFYLLDLNKPINVSDNMMMKTIFSLSLLIYSMSAHAADCRKFVGQAQAMQSQIMNLSYFDKNQREIGISKQESVLRMYDAFDQIPVSDKCRVNAWKALIDLSQAQAPFDMDSETQQIVAKKLVGQPELNSIYQNAVRAGQFPDQCRSELFRLAVIEIQNRNAGLPTPPDHFSYEDCASGKSGKTEKKSPNEVAANCPNAIHKPSGVQSSAFGSIVNALRQPASTHFAGSNSSAGIAQNRGLPLDIRSNAQRGSNSGRRGPASVPSSNQYDMQDAGDSSGVAQ